MPTTNSPCAGGTGQRPAAQRPPLHSTRNRCWGAMARTAWSSSVPYGPDGVVSLAGAAPLRRANLSEKTGRCIGLFSPSIARRSHQNLRSAALLGVAVVSAVDRIAEQCGMVALEQFRSLADFEHFGGPISRGLLEGLAFGRLGAGGRNDGFFSFNMIFSFLPSEAGV